MAFVHKIKTRYKEVGDAKFRRYPAILTEQGILISHLRFLDQFSDKSESWRAKSIQAVMLLLTFINENRYEYSQVTKLLKKFAKALHTGTIDEEMLEDKSGLFWEGRRADNVRILLEHINQYTDYLAEQAGFSENRINPFRKATSYEQKLNWCAYYNKKRNIFLNHLKSGPTDYQKQMFSRMVRGPEVIQTGQDKKPRFPKDKIEDLLYKGFVNDGKADFQAIAITMLMHYGGLRASEVFHIYTGDIVLDPNSPDRVLVRVFHPSQGKSPDENFLNRDLFLRRKTKYIPRTKYPRSEALHAGWKSPKLEGDFFMEVVFSPSPKAEEFLQVWLKYLEVRVEPSKEYFHPFAFTNSLGKPETLRNFKKKHKKAVEKIGLICKKCLGTTEHGHRHSYAYRLRDLGFTQIEIQKTMHHQSPESCLVYLSPSYNDLRKHLDKIDEKRER